MVFAGRARIEGLHRLTAEALKKGWVKLSQHAIADLDWWTKIIDQRNGTNIIIQQPMQWEKFTSGDASLFAIGAFCDGWWCAYCVDPDKLNCIDIPDDAPAKFGMLFTESEAGKALPKKLMPTKQNKLLENIAYLELLIVYVSIFEHKLKWRGLHVPIYSDNKNVIAWLTKNTAGSIEAARLLRFILDLCVELNIRIMPFYIDTKTNKIADTLSRLEWNKFCEAVNDPKFHVPPRMWAPYPVAQQDFVDHTVQA